MRAAAIWTFLVVMGSLGCGMPPSGADSGAGGSAGGGAGGGAGGSSGAPLAIVTQSLAAATVGQAYAQSVSATGGKAPYIWGVSTASAELSWLHIDSTSGQLSGIPTQALVAGGRVTLAVTDQAATTATKELALVVLGCTEGAVVDCVSSANGICTTGKQQCTNGTLPADCPGSLSVDRARCGTSCGPCGPQADSCTGGACTCGSSAACSSAQACCGGSCTPLDSVNHCGSCSNDCQAQAGPNVAAVCASGQCAFMCKADYQNCSTSPTSNGCGSFRPADPRNCGACGNDCAPTPLDAGTSWWGCDAGTCQIVCQTRTRDCDGDFRNGCEQPIDVNHCTACNASSCPVAGTNHISTSNCVVSGSGFACSIVCMSGYTNCDTAINNGCEKNTAGDMANCGTCGHVCDPALTDNCTGGTCMCGSSGVCAPDQRCVGGQCVCNSTSCTGCCSGNSCLPGTSNSWCGFGGLSCRPCQWPMPSCQPCTAIGCGTLGGSCR